MPRAERVPERWQRVALLLAILPFWTSYVVRSYAWTLVLAGSREGGMKQCKEPHPRTGIERSGSATT